jgi:uncharacterized protein affecting Mg2+/Co2+ transport
VRRWTATDRCGNTQSTQQTITVQDVTKPVFTSIPADETVSCESLPSVGMPQASDNCDPSVVITYNGEIREDGNCLYSYLLRRRWTATDACGNTNTAEQRITVRDLKVPVFTQTPADVTVSCENVPAVGNTVATDNCDPTVAISYNGETRIDGNCPNAYTLKREWTAMDNCGNSSRTTQTITVRDVTPPVFTFVPAATMASCEALPPVGTPTATDNCATDINIVYLGESVPGNTGACPGNYAIIRTWSATDECGNSATATQEITVQDITAPVVTSVPADVTVSCAAIPSVGTPTATDNCDANLDIVYSGATRIDGACPNTYILKRNWVVSDDCGNSATAVQTVTVQDITAPIFTSVPANTTVSCESIPNVGNPVAVDDCASAVTILYNGAVRADGACPDTYTLTRSWTAIDSCGNSANATQVITVQDISAPIFISVPPGTTVSCDAIPAPGTAQATDNCDASVSIVYQGETRVDGNCPNRYTLSREWLATDNCGNTAKATQVIVVQDITAPIFVSVPAPVTVSCDAVPVPGAPVASDNCSGMVTINYLGETRTDGNCPGNYRLVRSWSATDVCGNSSTASQTINIQDITKPVVISVPANVTVSCSDIPAVGTPTAIDNCDAAPVITYSGATRTNGACPNTYTLTRKWVISDNCGNTSSAVQTIAVQDINPPIFITVPAATTVSCESVPPVGTPSAMDNCASSVQITYNGAVRTDGACPDSYTLRRSWTAQDSCGNTSTAVQIITVQDIVPPIFTMIPADVTVSCDAIPMATTPTAVDNCASFVSITYSGQTRIDGNCTYTYQLRREWVATDNCGNTSKATQVIAVQDINPPVFTSVPAAATVSCDAVPTEGQPTAVDNCDPSVEVSYIGETKTAGNCPSNYTLTRRWEAKDDCGNKTTATQLITVQDIVKPVFAYVPADSTVNCDAIPLAGTPIATDNCTSNPSIVFDGETIMNSSSPDSYSFQRHWTVTDNCGNSATAIQILTVQDTIAPSIQCPADIQKFANAATCSAVATFAAPPLSDNCSAALTLVSSANSGQAFPVGTTVVYMTVNDPSGNATICNFKVTVVDTTAPVLHNCPANLTFTTSGNSCETSVFWDEPFVTDPCDQYLIVPTKTIASGSVLSTGIVTNTYTAVDTTGNMVQCSFTITVKEIVPPVIHDCPQDMTLYTDHCDIVATWVEPTATDNCAMESLTVNIPPGSTFPEATTTVEYLAKDNWGNTATCDFKVTVVDMMHPQFSGCPDDIVVDAGVCSIPVSWVQPTATDNCQADPLVYSVPAPGDVFPSGFTTVHVFAKT